MFHYLKCSDRTVPDNVKAIALEVVCNEFRAQIMKSSGFYKIAKQKVSLHGRPVGKPVGVCAVEIKTGKVYKCKGNVITSNQIGSVTI